MTAGDGLLVVGRTLYVVQNQLNNARFGTPSTPDTTDQVTRIDR